MHQMTVDFESTPLTTRAQQPYIEMAWLCICIRYRSTTGAYAKYTFAVPCYHSSRVVHYDAAIRCTTTGYFAADRVRICASNDNGFQVHPLNHSGTAAYELRCYLMIIWMYIIEVECIMIIIVSCCLFGAHKKESQANASTAYTLPYLLQILYSRS